MTLEQFTPLLPKISDLRKQLLFLIPFSVTLWFDLSYPAVKTARQSLISSSPSNRVHFWVCLLSLPGSCYLHPDLTASLLKMHRPPLFCFTSPVMSIKLTSARANASTSHSLTSALSSPPMHSPDDYILFQQHPKSGKTQQTKKHEDSEFSKNCMQLHLRCIINVYKLHS